MQGSHAYGIIPAFNNRSKRRGRDDAMATMSLWESRDDSHVPAMLGGGDHGGILRNVIVTGANRGLGFAIADRMLELGDYHVVLACRNEQEGRDALERLRAKQQQRRQRQPCTIATASLASFFPIDVTCPRSVEAFREDCVNGHLGGRVDILFNNAGVCFPEKDRKGPQNRAAAAGILRETLAVNFFGALEVVEACMPALEAAALMVAQKEKKKAGLMLEGNGITSTMKSLKPPTVVWISSGDGELCFLGGKWRGLLAEAQSLEDVKSPLSDLLAAATDTITTTSKENSTAPTGSQQEGEQAQVEEIAFGPTPAYSLSKAAVNAAVRTWAPCIQAPTVPAEASENTKSRTGVRGRGVRLVAVCPGDVLTRMTSKEEMARGDAVSPEEAAVEVVDIALSSANDIPTGRFYRHGEDIGW
ncbi:unnamed protein product [Ectocarpus sp. CCAP 1310/34]|nr:unnamed protein product [Ectocarpus sp. CCAP 1310/34]